ncbi:MAG: 3'(2'),5'-bisphosphate nucleotidase CysQ [Actinomycetota bacterium]
MTPANDHVDAARYARSAGRVLLGLRDGFDRSPGALGDAGDDMANRHLLALITADHPDDRVLSEESADDRRRLEAERVWIIDPLDGTREYTEAGRSDWAVHVALWERGRGLTAGAVALPALDTVLSTDEPPVVPARANRPLRVVVSRSRAPAVAMRVANGLDADLVTLGSAGAKTMSVVLGEADAYVHAGGQYEWDSAAPAVVARAAGLHASRLDGSPLEYNQSSPWLPDLVVCRPEIAERVLAITTR